jgi:TRAP-type transport system periplasmic protein
MISWRLSDFLLLALIFVAAPLALWGTSQIGEKPAQTLDLSSPWGLSEYHTANAQRFAREVSEVTQGRVRITVHPAAVLGIKGQDSLRAVTDGVVAMTDMAGFQQVGVEPILGTEALPFLMDSQADLQTLYQGLRPAVTAALERRGVKVLLIVPWPSQYFFTKQRIDDPAQAAGLKMRTQDKITTALVERLGWAAIQMPSADVVPALASGAIDATMTSATTAAAQKYWEFLRYAYATNHIWATNYLIINRTTWDALAPTDQRAIEALAAKLEPQFWAIAAQDDAKQMALLQKNGMTRLEPSPALALALRAAGRPLWDAFLAQTPAARPAIEGYLAQRSQTKGQP